MLQKALASVAILLIVGACSTRRDSNPQRTATEQLLISAAADRAAEGIALQVPPGAKVFVDSSNVEGLDSKYAVAAMRERVLELGGQLVGSRADADAIVEIRSGALSIDEKKTLVGIPEFGIPIPLAGALEVPEIALFKKAQRKGVAKFAGVAYDAKDGRLIGTSEPQYGFSHETRWVVLLLFSWEDTDMMPEPEQSQLVDADILFP